MFNSSSLVDFLNAYLVENLTQSLVAALIVVPISAWLVRSSRARIRYLLVPLLLPVFCPPLYYVLVPGRRDLPVIPLDRLLGLKQGLSFVSQWPEFTTVFTLAFLAATLYFLGRGAIALTAALYLPHRYPRPIPEQERRLDRLLAPLLARAGLPRPLILQSPSWHPYCCAFGFRRPYLLLSTGLLESLDDAHLEGVLAHELAHCLRRDPFLNLLLLTLRSFFFFNPLVHLLCRAVTQEQELACDALAIRLGQSPLTYAESLVKVWRQGFSVPALWKPAASGFLTEPAALHRRVIAVLEKKGLERAEYGRLLVVVTGSLLVGLFFIC